MTGPFNRIIEAVAAIATKLGATVTNTGNRLADNLEGIAEVAGGGGKVFIIQEYYDEDTDEPTYIANTPFATDEYDSFQLVRDNGEICPLTHLGNGRFFRVIIDPISHPTIYVECFDPTVDDDTGLLYTLSTYTSDLEFTLRD